MVYSFPPPKAATTKKVMMVIWVAVATLGVGFGFSVIGMLQSNTLPATGYSCRQILIRWIGLMFRLPYMRFLGDVNFGQKVMIAGTNARLHKYDSSVKSNLPLCLTAAETCDHVLKYEQEDRVRSFSFSSLTIICVNMVAISWYAPLWLWVTESIRLFVWSLGILKDLVNVLKTSRSWYAQVRSQDKIGWRRFMEGMISIVSQIRKIQDMQSRIYGCHGLRLGSVSHHKTVGNQYGQ